MIHVSASWGSLAAPVLYAAAFVVLLAPGYAVARTIVVRGRLDAAATLPIAFAVTSLAGFAAFWSYLLAPQLGRLVSFAWAAVALVSVRMLSRRAWRRDELVPLVLTFAVGACYLAVLYLPTTAIDASQRFFVMRPPDNIIPQLFAERLYQGADPRHLIGDWLSSDRPPLQTGFDLLMRPFFAARPTLTNLGYEAAGVVAQLAWLPAMWLLCTRAGYSPRSRAVVLALATASGFCLYNTDYTWPKLLSAGLSLSALAFALPRAAENRTISLVLAGICAALAFLAHGSAVFFVVPATVCVAVAGRLPLRRELAWAAAAAVVLVAPWFAYQRYYDPPGDRLLKMHLAGINAVDPRPAAQAIAETYAGTPLAQIVRYKAANVATALGAAPLLGSAVAQEPVTPLTQWRLRERELVTVALGIANLGWLLLPWYWRRHRDESQRRWSIGLLGVAAASTAFWCVAMWGPGATVTTHSAYALDLILFVVLGAAIAEARAIALTVLGLAVVDVVVTWVCGSLGDAWRVSASLDPVMVACALATAGVVFALLASEMRRDVRSAA